MLKLLIVRFFIGLARFSIENHMAGGNQYRHRPPSTFRAGGGRNRLWISGASKDNFKRHANDFDPKKTRTIIPGKISGPQKNSF